MNIKLIKALWGMDSMPLDDKFARIAAAGCYKGIESPLPAKEEENQFRELLSKYSFDYIAMVFTEGEDHLDSFQRQIDQAAAFNPILINAHSSKDSMPYEKQLDFYTQALLAEKKINIPVGHETHRGRAMFNPWGTAQLLKDLPELRITADFSHWVCVCESLLEDQLENLKLAFERTVHIHSRVGYAEGPQVPHPAAPEYSNELETHEGWWQQIIHLRNQQNLAPITVTPEFGPPGYMHTLPFTKQPVADLWDVCLWMAHRLESKL